MKNLYNEFFRIPKDGKIHDKVMLVRVVSTVAIILACLLTMSITAYAYFSYNVTSSLSTFKAAHFETEILLQVTADDGETVDLRPVTSNHQAFKIDLEADKLYTVTISPTENSSAKTGFILLTADGCDNRYHTQQLGKSGEQNVSELSFQLQVSADTCVRFSAQWGTSSYYGTEDENSELYILQGETVELPVNAVETDTTTTEAVSGTTATDTATTTTASKFPIVVATTTASETAPSAVSTTAATAEMTTTTTLPQDE